MRASIQDVVRAVSETLLNQVLPQLEAASWTASNVRACAMLLVYVEDRVTGELALLRDTNAAMRTLLQEAAATAAHSALRAECTAVLNSFAQGADAADVDLLTRENEAYKEALARLSRRMSELRMQSGRQEDGALRSRLQDTLRAVHEREHAIAARANQYIPL